MNLLAAALLLLQPTLPSTCFAYAVTYFSGTPEVGAHALVTNVVAYRTRDFDDGCGDQDGAIENQVVDALRAAYPEDWHGYSWPVAFTYDSRPEAFREHRRQLGELRADWVVEVFPFQYFPGRAPAAGR